MKKKQQSCLPKKGETREEYFGRLERYTQERESEIMREFKERVERLMYANETINSIFENKAA